MDFKKYVKVNPSLVFDDNRFIEAYLKKNTKWSKRNEFYKYLEKCDKQLKDDCRLSIRGHDFTTLLLHYFNKKYHRKRLDKIDLFEGFLLSSLDRCNLLEEGMLKMVHEFSLEEIHV